MSTDGLDDYEAEEIDVDDAVERVLENAVAKGALVKNGEDWISCCDSAVIFDDHVVIDGDVTLPYETYNGVAVIFEKGLSVNGVLRDASGEEAVVIVVGDLDAKHMICTNHWLVGGDVKVEGTLLGLGTGDFDFEFDGEGHCKQLVLSGYNIEIDADKTIDAELDPTAVLSTDVLTDEEIDLDKVMSKLSTGASLLRV